METLSVIIPVYNRESLITRTLDSVAAQKVRPQRLIVVDNASTDSTRRVVEEWMVSHQDITDMKMDLLSERHPGAAAARNKGLAAADTDWVMFFDSDDEMLPGHIERAMETAKRNPQADIIGWDVDIQLPDGHRRTGRFMTRDMEWNNIVHGIMSTLRYMARTEIIRHAGAWSEDVMVWDDWELGIRLLRLNPQVTKAEGRNTVRIHFTPKSLTGTRHHADRCLHVLGKAENILKKGGNRKLMRWLDYRRAVLAAECRKQGDRIAADAILAQTLVEKSMRERTAIRLTYLHTLILGRGAHLTFRLLSG